MVSETVYDIIAIVTGFLCFAIILYVKYIADKKNLELESKKAMDIFTKTLNTLSNAPSDILSTMYRNVAELKGYYTLNKYQARSAYTSALFMCFLGFTIFIIGVVINYLSPSKKTIIPYATLAGAVVEVISGLFFWLYNQALKQIKLFVEKLTETQRYLAAIQIAKSISEENRDKVYADIVDKLMRTKK